MSDDKKDMISSIIVGPANKMRSKFSYFPVKDFDGYLVVPSRDNIDSLLRISGGNKMSSKFNRADTSDLLGGIQIPERKYLDGEMKIVGKNRAVAKYDLPTYSEKPSDITIKIPSSVDSSITVNRPENKMTATAEYIEVPKMLQGISPIEDAFVRSSIPKLNYGFTQDMFVGVNGNGEIFRSFVKFPMDVIPKDHIIISAKLQLFHASDHSAQTIMGMYEATENWAEGNITFDNQPHLSTLVTTVGTGLDYGMVEVDITHLAADWYNGVKDNFGLILRSMDETQKISARYHTREYAPRSPKLVVQYYNPDMYTFAKDDRVGKMIVRKSRVYNTQSHINVRAALIYDEIESGFTIARPHELPSTISVSRPDISTQGTMKVMYRENPQIPSDITVRHSYYDEIISNDLRVQTPDKPGTIRIKYPHDTESTIRPRVPGHDSLPANMIIHQPDLVSTMRIRDRVDLNSSLSIPLKSHTPGDVSITREALRGQLRVGLSSNLQSGIIVRRKEVSNLNSVLKVRNTEYFDMPSRIDLYEKNDMGGGGESSSKPTATISRPDMSSRLTVRRKAEDEIDASVDVKFRGNATLPGNTIKVMKRVDRDTNSFFRLRVTGISDIDSEMEVFFSKRTPGEITVRRQDDYDKLSNLRIRYALDIASEIIVRQKDKKDMPSSIQVQKSGKFDRTSSLKVRVPNESSLPGSVDVHHFNDLDSGLIVRALGRKDLPSTIQPRIHYDKDGTITIKYRDNLDMESEVTVRRATFDDTEATIIVRQYDEKDLPGEITVFVHNDLESSLGVAYASRLPSTIEVVTGKSYSFIM